MRIQSLIFSTLLLILLTSGSCKQPGQSEDIIKTATLKGPGGMAMIKMIEELPVFGDVKTSFDIKNEPNQVRDLMFREEVDFAVLPMNTAALLYNKGLPYILAAVPVWGTLYLFGSDPNIKTWQDLKGKKVSLMGKGMTPDIIFRFLAKENGINPDTDIICDYSFPSHIELANAIAAGVSDLGVISEPMVSLVIRKNPGVKAIMDFNTEWVNVFGDSIPFAQTALMVHKNLAAENPELVDAYLDKLEESINWVNNRMEEASVLIAKHNILPDKELAYHSIPFSNLNYTLAYKEKEGIDEYLKVFFNFNPLSIGGKLPDENFYYKKQAD